MCHLVPFVQFKKRAKNHAGVILLVITILLKETLFHVCFSRFLNCANGTK